MPRILLIYDSGYEATADVAEIIAGTLRENGMEIDLRVIRADKSFPGGLSKYDAVIVGSPIRLGRCMPAIRRFLTKHGNELASTQVVFFFTCMSVTDRESTREFPLYLDPSFHDPDKPAARLRFMENNHAVSYYLKHVLKFVPEVTPLSISFFKGNLNTEKMNYFHRLVMRFAMFTLPEIRNGNFVNPVVVRAWTESLASLMNRV